MRSARLGLIAITLVGAPRSLHGQQIDPRLRGNWTLDVSRSTFGPDGAPSAGVVRWTTHGWVLALAFPGGYVYADAVVTDQGCALIGVAPGFHCSLRVVSPTHVRFTLREGEVVRRVGDTELVAADTTRTVHRVTPNAGSPFTETTYWARDRK